MHDLQQIKHELLSSKNIVIASHEFPDGDSIGSSLALYCALKELGLQVCCVVNDEIPKKLSFLPEIHAIIRPQETVYDEGTTLVFIDCADEYRAGDFLCANMKNCRMVINIDHHEGNTAFGTLNYVDIQAAAAGEIIFHLLKEMSIEIMTGAACALYTAIATDTGSFRFDNTTSRTLYIAKQLVDCGANISKVRINIWESETISSLKLLGDVLTNLQLAINGKVAYIIITKDIFEKWGIHPRETEGLVNYPKSIEGIKVAIIFKETDNNEIKVSFRSKDDTNVRLVAKHFGGGGHSKAAGCTIKGPLADTIHRVMTYLEEKIIS